MTKLFRLQYVSDIHLEFYDKQDKGQIDPLIILKPSADYLALCGDIGFPERPALLSFLSWCSKNFKEVFWVPGNHEYYNYSLARRANMEEKNAMCEMLCDGFTNVHFMNRKVRQIPDTNVRIAGCTLWSWIPPEEDERVMKGMNDCRQISLPDSEYIYPHHIRVWHERDKAWLSEEIRKAAVAQEDLIVLTHHLPTYKLISDMYKDHPYNCCFASNLDTMIQPPVKAWLCGHSHAGNEVIVNGIPCALNPMGYPMESKERFSRTKVFELICDSDEHDVSSEIYDSDA